MANAGLGNLRSYLQQALGKLGKLLVLVPAQHSSQECAACGFTHEGKRPDQATFLCQRCGHADHADFNAANIIRQRGIALISSAGTADRARRVPKGRGAIRRTRANSPPQPL